MRILVLFYSLLLKQSAVRFQPYKTINKCHYCRVFSGGEIQMLLFVLFLPAG